MHTAAIHDNDFYEINENNKIELCIQLSTTKNTIDGKKQMNWLNHWVQRVRMIYNPGISLPSGKYSSIQLPECNLFYIPSLPVDAIILQSFHLPIQDTPPIKS